MKKLAFPLTLLIILCAFLVFEGWRLSSLHNSLEIIRRTGFSEDTHERRKIVNDMLASTFYCNNIIKHSVMPFLNAASTCKKDGDCALITILSGCPQDSINKNNLEMFSRSGILKRAKNVCVYNRCYGAARAYMAKCSAGKCAAVAKP